MPIGPLIQAWRVFRHQSIQSLSDAAGIDAQLLVQIEENQTDPSACTIEALAAALRVPAPWLFEPPQSFATLFDDQDDEDGPSPTQPDPVTERILSGSRMDRSLYVLLTALVQAGDPQLGEAVPPDDRTMATTALGPLRAA
jgi:transcriptional regulator with XRE-family HTH domain